MTSLLGALMVLVGAAGLLTLTLAARARAHALGRRVDAIAPASLR